MGQYFSISNLSKREGFHPFDINSSAKLMEFSYFNTRVSFALLSLLKKDWHGDTIALIGDYFLPEECNRQNLIFRLDKTKAYYNTIKDALGYLEKAYQNANALKEPAEKEDFYKSMVINFLEKHRYFINYQRKQYIDLVEYFENGFEVEKSVYVINPVAILLAAGNGLGSGDYKGICAGYPGLWAGEEVGVSENLPSEFKKVRVLFTEKDVCPETDNLFTEKDILKMYLEDSGYTIYAEYTGKNYQGNRHKYRFYVRFEEENDLINITEKIPKVLPVFEYDRKTNTVVVTGCGFDTLDHFRRMLSKELFLCDKIVTSSPH